MRWFQNSKMSTKLLLSFGVMCALLIGLAVGAYGTLATIQATERGEVDESRNAEMTVIGIRADLNRIRGRTIERLITTQDSERVAIKRELAEIIDEVHKGVEQVSALLTARHDTQNLEALADLKGQLALYFESRAEAFRLTEEGKIDEARGMLVGIQHERFEGLRKTLIRLGEGLHQRAVAAVAESGALFARIVRVFVATTIVAVSFALFMVWAMNRLIAAPLQAVTGVAERIAAGDLTVRVEAEDRSDEVGVLQRAMRTMVDNLRSLNRELQSGFSVLASSSTEILATVSQVAAGASETATAVNETSTTAEEVKQTALLSNQKAKVVQETAQKAAAVSETGRKAVADTIEGMERVRDQMESIAESVVRLSEQGQSIGEIIATVNDLAEQSNLLAVNAAIEATRAGEYGKGFGVVAQEVRSLAEQSRQATTQVRTILMEVQKATSAAVMATEQGTKAVAAGVRQATDAGESIRILTGSVSDAAQAATQIAASSQQQLVGMDQIASAIGYIRQATAQNMAGTRQLESSARSLQELGGRLKVLVERQRVEG